MAHRVIRVCARVVISKIRRHAVPMNMSFDCRSIDIWRFLYKKRKERKINVLIGHDPIIDKNFISSFLYMTLNKFVVYKNLIRQIYLESYISLKA